MHYRYEKAVLSGNRFAVWLSLALGVRPKLMVLNLTPEEAAKLGIKSEPKAEIELPPGLNNGQDS